MSERQSILGINQGQICALTLAAAITGQAQTALIIAGLAGMGSLALEAILTVAGGGTTAVVWVQTSIDGGLTWFDIANFAFTNTTASKLSVVSMYPSTAFTAGTTPGDAALASNTVLNGIIGDRLRCKVTTTGTFTGATTLNVYYVSKG